MLYEVITAVILNLLLPSSQTLASTDGIWKQTGSMAAPRTNHTATLLPDGRVLIVGGKISGSVPAEYSNHTYHDSAELYDPFTGAFQVSGSMSEAREGHTATLLPNGKVLIAGGMSWNDDLFLEHASAELYDSSTGTFQATGSMSETRRNNFV